MPSGSTKDKRMSTPPYEINPQDYATHNFLDGMCTQGDLLVLTQDVGFCYQGSSMLYPTFTVFSGETIMYLGSTFTRNRDETFVESRTHPYDATVYFIHDTKILHDGYLVNRIEEIRHREKSLKELYKGKFVNISTMDPDKVSLLLGHR